MRALSNTVWRALPALLVLCFAGPALACRIAPQALADETPVSIEVIVQSAKYVSAEDELGQWRAVGSTTSKVPRPLKADEIEFSGYEHFSSCVSAYDKPTVGSRWAIFVGINSEGRIRLINLRPVQNP